MERINFDDIRFSNETWSFISGLKLFFENMLLLVKKEGKPMFWAEKCPDGSLNVYVKIDLPEIKNLIQERKVYSKDWDLKKEA